MTADDYINWAQEYRREAETVENLISRKKQELEHEGRSYEKMTIGTTVKRLESQRLKCLNTAKMLEERAACIRKMEE